MEPISGAALIVLKKAAIKFVANLVLKPKETLSKVLTVAGVCLAVPVLGLLVVYGIATHMPSFFAYAAAAPNATSNTQEIKAIISKYVAMEDRIRQYGLGQAQKKVDDYEKTTLLQNGPSTTPTPNPYATLYSDTQTPQPTAPGIQIDKDITDTLPSWRELLALATVYCGNDFTKPGIEKYIESYVKTKLLYDINADCELIKGQTVYSISINVTCYSLEQMAQDIKASTDDTPQGMAGLAAGYLQFLQYYDKNGVEQSTPVVDGSIGDVTLTPEEIAKLKAQIPPGTNATREAIVMAAYSIVGKVDYFWGGKSTAIGWDNRWGTPKKVTSAGNFTTGTIRPFGLDCSGFVAWVFVNATKDPAIVKVLGSGSTTQWKNSAPISWADALPGDLVFYNPPGGANHIGVLVGKNSKGDLLVAHSPKTGMKVSISIAKKSGFKYVRRPVLFIDTTSIN